MYRVFLNQELSVSKLIIVFVIGAFIGDILETVFCRITSGKWMNRSTYIFWPMSSVWGGAFVLAAIMFYWMENVSVPIIFILGVLLGTLYEYLYSFALEKIFGVKFWDYSGFRFHIKGRVNFVYSLGWGIVAVVWTKLIYPEIELWFHNMSFAAIHAVGVALTFELVIDKIVSIAALKRYSLRHTKGMSSGRLWGRVDRYFTDAYMEEIFPYMLRS